MAFKVKKENEETALKLVTFRFPHQLISELKRIAKKEKISVTKLVIQMLKHCIDDYNKR